MKRISLLVIVPLSLLMTSCAPIPDGQGYNNAPFGEEQMGPGYPNPMGGEGWPYLFYEGSPPPSFHDHDRGSHRDYNRDHGWDHDGDHNHDGLRDFNRDRK
jgi:hypothetical protein